LNEHFSVFGRYNYAPSRVQQRQPNLSLSTLQSTNVDTQTLTVGVNMALSARISNTLHGNYSKQSSASSSALDSFGGAVPINPALRLGALPASKNQGFFETFDLGAPYIVGPNGKNQTRQLNFVDALGITAGSHQLKFGGDYRAIFLDANGIGQVRRIKATNESRDLSPVLRCIRGRWHDCLCRGEPRNGHHR